MEIFSDEISERYRKYIIQLKLPEKQSLYLLWGTDTGNEGTDYLMLGPDHKILAFPTIKALLHYVKTTKETLVDASATTKWVSNYDANIAYTCYDMDLLINLMERSDKQVEDYTREEACELTAFAVYFPTMPTSSTGKTCSDYTRAKTCIYL